MRIGSITISNILSIKDATLQFGDSGLVLVDGWNFDDDTANGAGKSAIFNALSFGLYDKFPRKVTKSKVLRDGTKKGHVIVDDIVTGNGTWRVERYRPSRARYFKNNVEQNITQEEFEQHINMSYSQFLISMYASQTQGERFIDLNDTNKKDFLLTLMKLEKFFDVKKLADSKVSELDHEIHQLQIQEASLQSKIDVYEDSMDNIEDLTADIEKFTNGMNTSKIKIKEYEAVSRPDISQYDDITNKIQQHGLHLL